MPPGEAAGSLLVGGKWVLVRLANGWYQPAHADYVERVVRRHGRADYAERAVRRHGGTG